MTKRVTADVYRHAPSFEIKLENFLRKSIGSLIYRNDETIL